MDEVDDAQAPIHEKFERYCFWATHELTKAGSSKTVGMAQFSDHFADDLAKTKPSSRESTWTRVSHAVFATLRALNYEVTLDNKTLEFKGEIDRPKRFENDYFRPYSNYKEKQRIGQLVAYYLSQRPDRHVLLGSGSTVYHVGQQMRNFKPFKQLFWTINFPLLGDWAEYGDSPVEDVEVPQGKLRPVTFRYESMEPPPWNPPIVVIGADGCYYEETEKDLKETDRKETGTAYLFANRGSVAYNTNLFVRKASDTVICCLASPKLDYKKRLQTEGGRQNDGPRIEPPTKSHVRRLLVTDKMPEDPRIIEALKRDGWLPITAESQFPGPGDST